MGQRSRLFRRVPPDPDREPMTTRESIVFGAALGVTIVGSFGLIAYTASSVGPRSQSASATESRSRSYGWPKSLKWSMSSRTIGQRLGFGRTDTEAREPPQELKEFPPGSSTNDREAIIEAAWPDLCTDAFKSRVASTRTSADGIEGVRPVVAASMV